MSESDALSRARAGRVLFGGAAIGTTGFFAGLAVAALAGRDLGGSAAWSGVPGATGIVGTALGATAVTAVLRRSSRRAGLTVGYLVGAVGAVVAVVAVARGSFALLLAGSLLFGVAQASNQLTRYVVAELHEPARRGRALSWIVWAGTIGGVVGPQLITPAGHLARSLGLPELAGGYLFAVVGLLAVPLLYAGRLRPDPAVLAVADDLEDETDRPPDRVWGFASVRVAIAVLVTGQVVMVLLMSMTPVHIRESGGDLTRVGLILSAHVFGMYALAPLAGSLEDRFGSIRTIVVGLVVLATSAVVAAAAPVGGLLMAVALFLLGLGWSFGFVAGSALLTRGIRASQRAGVQGRVETVVWLSSAGASLTAGVLLDVVGYVGLCLLGLAALVVPIAFLLRQRVRLVNAQATV